MTECDGNYEFKRICTKYKAMQKEIKEMRRQNEKAQEILRKLKMFMKEFAEENKSSQN